MNLSHHFLINKQNLYHMEENLGDIDPASRPGNGFGDECPEGLF